MQKNKNCMNFGVIINDKAVNGWCFKKINYLQPSSTFWSVNRETTCVFTWVIGALVINWQFTILFIRYSTFYSNKWINPIFSSKSLFFFSTQLLLKIPLFELNNCFLFHQTWAVDIRSIHEFLQLSHDLLESDNTITPSVYVFPAV